MRILIATPLFPPDIGGGAWCSKELAYRLSRSHDVTVLTYAKLPEPAGAAKIISIPKRSLPFRLISYFIALLRHAAYANILYIENGASVEVPAALLSLIWNKSMILHVSDLAAVQKNTGIAAWAHRRVLAKARLVDTPPARRPEILPFSTTPTRELESYERSWEQHIAFVTHALHA